MVKRNVFQKSYEKQILLFRVFLYHLRYISETFVFVISEHRGDLFSLPITRNVTSAATKKCKKNGNPAASSAALYGKLHGNPAASSAAMYGKLLLTLNVPMPADAVWRSFRGVFHENRSDCTERHPFPQSHPISIEFLACDSLQVN